MSSWALLFRTKLCAELVETNKEHEDIKRLLDGLTDKIRAWPSSELSSHSRRGVIDFFLKQHGCF